MKITAIWSRTHIAPRSRTVFAFDADSSSLLEITPVDKFTGVVVDGKRQYEDTGELQVSDFFERTGEGGLGAVSKVPPEHRTMAMAWAFANGWGFKLDWSADKANV